MDTVYICMQYLVVTACQVLASYNAMRIYKLEIDNTLPCTIHCTCILSCASQGRHNMTS